MAIFTVTGTVTNAAGSTPFTGSFETVDAPTNATVVVAPFSAPAGTQRTATISATGTGLIYTLEVNGTNIPHLPADPPNVFKFVG